MSRLTWILALACLVCVAAPGAALAQKSNLSPTQKAKLAARKRATARYQAQQRAHQQDQAYQAQQVYQVRQKQAAGQLKLQMEFQRTASLNRMANAFATEAAVAKKELQLDQMKAGVPFIPTPNGFVAYPYAVGGGSP